MLAINRLLSWIPFLSILAWANCANADFQFTPLIDGDNSAQFEFYHPFMAITDQKSVALKYGPFHLHSLSTIDLARIASPLIDKIMDSGYVNTVNVTSAGDSTKQSRVANVVFFLASIHPDVLIAIPDNSEDINTQQGNIQNMVVNFKKQINTFSISNLVLKGQCTSAEYATGSESCKFMGKRQPIVNQIIISRVFVEQKETLIVSDQMKSPVALGNNFVADDIKFEFRPIEGMSGYLEMRVTH